MNRCGVVEPIVPGMQDADLVDFNARQVARSTGCDADELRSFGLEALWKAGQSFDPSHGVPFRRWANLRIRGAMIDAVRAADPLTRAQRKSTDRPCFVSIDEWQSHGGDVAASETSESSEDRDRMCAAALRLPPVGRTLVLACTLLGIELTTVAESLGISKSWASRMHGKAIENIRREMTAHHGVADDEFPKRVGRGAPWKHGLSVRERVRDLITSGMSHRQVAAAVGLPTSTVGDIAKRLGVRRDTRMGGLRIKRAVSLGVQQ